MPSVVRVSPHHFAPMRVWDLRRNGRCLACLLPMRAHPIHCWVPARPVGDRRRAELSWATLKGGTERDA